MTTHSVAVAAAPLSTSNLLSVFLGLMFVVALLLAAAWMIRRFQRVQVPRESLLQVTAQLSLGLKERVILIRVGDEHVLIGSAPGSIRALHSWHDAHLATNISPPAEVIPPDFMSHLRSVLAAQGLRRPGAQP